MAAALGLPLTRETLDLGAKELLPSIAIAYVVGIIIDRVARWASEHTAMGQSLEDAERLICDRSERLWNTCTYNRSRLRICRAWTLNFALIGIGYMVWNFSVGQHQPLAAAVVVAAGMALSASAAWVTVQLSQDYKAQVAGVAAFLAKASTGESSKDQPTCSPPPT
jgi:hypothetical protein